MDLNPDMLEYYDRRAPEFEEVYHVPERQPDLDDLRQRLCTHFAGRRVLDVACGTGYWTHFIAKSAQRITATDAGSKVMEAAYMKDYGDCPVEFIRSDAYNLAEIKGDFDACFVGFFWSHILKQRRPDFLKTICSKLAPGSTVVMIDNMFVEGEMTPLHRSDEEGNTYRERRLRDGSAYEIVKNYPTEAEMRHDLTPFGEVVEWRVYKYYWWVEWRTKADIAT
ncbi:MAG: hypothetical protein Kow0074_21170 [Candidatus Zixiibacteriota bacterium]